VETSNLSNHSSGLNYNPLGMLLVDRNLAAGSEYKYGFNGKENDDEIAGNNNALDFGARIYDVRLGRWLSVDPIEKKYAMYSAYAFCVNNPILFVDLDGNDWFINTRTGMVVYIKEAKAVSKEVFDKVELTGENPNEYERLGTNEMFGEKVTYGAVENVLDNKASVFYLGGFDNDFFEQFGYFEAEKVIIEEKESISGGRMGSENIVLVYTTLVQIGYTKKTLVKKETLNKKEDIKTKSESFDYSSYTMIRYKLTKPAGQKNKVTATLPNNKTNVTKQNVELVAAIFTLVTEIFLKK